MSTQNLSILNTYSYTYAGSELRQLNFYQTPDSKLKAKVFAIRDNAVFWISTIDPEKIYVDIKTYEEKKAEIINTQNTGGIWNLFASKISEISEEDQTDVITQLQPNGKWAIEIENEIGEKYEKAISLCIFDPNFKPLEIFVRGRGQPFKFS